MAAKVKPIEVWTGDFEDKPGTLDDKLAPVAAAGADLTFIVAGRQADRPGRAFVFLGPLKGAKQTKAAEAAGLRPATESVTLHFEGKNKPGSAQAVTRCIAEEGITLRGLVATTIGNNFALILTFDTPEAADHALKAIKAGVKKPKSKKK